MGFDSICDATASKATVKLLGALEMCNEIQIEEMQQINRASKSRFTITLAILKVRYFGDKRG